MSFINQLAIYARTINPASSIPSSVRLTSNATTLTIFDKFPKAKYHFLVLPRVPLHINVPPNDIIDIPEDDLASLRVFLQSPHAGSIVEELSDAADEVVEMVRDEMMKTEGFVWDVNVGFHAVPSMHHLHLHIISSDLISPSLKNKKHYQSFNPKHGFFLHLKDVKEMIERGQTKLPREIETYEEIIMRGPMECFKCGQVMRNIPTLKEHLDAEWKAEKKEATKVKT